eukprot:EC692360.1.p1 GENE.EC692360.1~~EC692360.1.p1  ORF type:complete len:235 (+),score=66.14 EC692360.1:77-706(+)
MEPTKKSVGKNSVRCQLEHRGQLDGTVGIHPEQDDCIFLCLDCAVSALLMDERGYRWVHDLLFDFDQLRDMLALGARLPEGWSCESLPAEQCVGAGRGSPDSNAGTMTFVLGGDKAHSCDGAGCKKVVVQASLCAGVVVGDQRLSAGALFQGMSQKAACCFLWWDFPSQLPVLRCMTGLFVLMHLAENAPLPLEAAAVVCHSKESQGQE